MSFWSELKRRHVVRVALVYLAVVFAVLQAADLLIPALHLPAWLMTAIAVVALLGLPIALVLAWAFEITPEGVQRTEAVPASSAVQAASQTRWVSGRTILVIGVALAITAATSWFAGRISAGGTDERGTLRSVAVLPFTNLGDDAANQHFSDGLAEELLSVLQQVDGLKVAARTSSFLFRDQNVDVREAAAKLGVESVVTGSVQKQNDRVRVRAQLVQASDGFQVWSDSYEGDLADVFALQDRLANAIAGALRVKLGLEDQSRQQRGLTEDLEAYDLYLLGRHQFAQRTFASLEAAIRHYNAAIAKDSTFGLAYSGLVDVYLVRPFYDVAHTFREAAELSRPLVKRALSLSPDRGEVQATAGLLALYGDRDFQRARQHLNRAEELAPSFASLYHYRRQLYNTLYRHDLALRDAYRAVELDPLSPIMLGGNLAIELAFADSLEAAARYYAKAVQNWRAPTLVWRGYAELLSELGRVKESEPIWVKWAESLGYAHPERAVVMAHAFESAEARALLDDIVATTKAKRSNLVFEYFRADRETAIRVATEAVEDGNIWAIFLNIPLKKREFRAVQLDPRYVALMKRVGLTLPDYVKP
ncbi:MAG: hypothetical protein WEE89_03530 [Gemmatimonadota bacterium]